MLSSTLVYFTFSRKMQLKIKNKDYQYHVIMWDRQAKKYVVMVGNAWEIKGQQSKGEYIRFGWFILALKFLEIPNVWETRVVGAGVYLLIPRSSLYN